MDRTENSLKVKFKVGDYAGTCNVWRGKHVSLPFKGSPRLNKKLIKPIYTSHFD